MPLLLLLLVAALSLPAAVMAADTIVSVGTRFPIDFDTKDIDGTGPWTCVTATALDPAIGVGDTFRDSDGQNGPYLITFIAGDRLTFTVAVIADYDTPIEGTDCTSGRAYSTIGAAEADIPNLYTLVGAGDTFEIHVFADALITEAPVLINDTTLGSTGTFKITVPPGERHDGTAGTGARWQCTQQGINIWLNVPSPNTPATQTIEWLEIVGRLNTTTHTVGIRVDESGTKTTLRNLIVHDYSTNSGSETNSNGIRVSAEDVDIINCLFYDIASGGTNSWARGIYISTEGGRCRILNCTFERCDTHAIREDQSCGCGGSEVLPIVRNCAAFNCGTVTFKSGGQGWHGGGGNNATDDDAAPGSNNLLNLTDTGQFVSVTDGSEDYHLEAGSDCLANGADLSTDFTDDIDAETRDFWDIGADEGAGGATFYVNADDTVGDDTNSGRSTTDPWKTVAKVNGLAFRPGDSILFKRGEDFIGQLVPAASGNATHSIVFGAYGPRTPNGTKPEEWTSPDDWPRIGYDYRIDAGSTWTAQGAGVYSITLSGISSISYANYRDPLDRDTTYLVKPAGAGIGGSGCPATTIDDTGRFDFASNELTIHLLDGSNPTGVHVYLNTGTKSDSTGHHAVKVDGYDYIIVDGLHPICGRTGVYLKDATNCQMVNSLCTGDHTGGARAVGCTDTTFLNNEVTESGKGLTFTCDDPACTTASSGLIKDNYIHDIDVDRSRIFCPTGADAEGIAIGHPGGENTIEIVGNRLENVGGFAAIIIHDNAISGTGEIEIHRNRIVNDFVSRPLKKWYPHDFIPLGACARSDFFAHGDFFNGLLGPLAWASGALWKRTSRFTTT